MTTDERIRAAVERIWKARQEYYRLRFDDDSPQELGPPATAEGLARIEGLLGGPLPPSYRAFLSRYDGWLHWSGGAMILPTGEHEKPWVAARMKGIRAHFKEFYDERTLDGAFVIMVGEDEPNFVYLDRKHPTSNGELEVVHADLIDKEYGRYPDFIGFLEASADNADQLVEKARME